MIVFMSISCQKTTSPEEMVTFIKSYGGQYMDAGYEVIQSSDGGYVIADYTESSANNKDVHVFKVDSEGNLVWKRTIVSSDNEVAYDIKQTPDGGYIVAGETSSDALLIKLDSQGNVQWQKKLVVLLLMEPELLLSQMTVGIYCVDTLTPWEQVTQIFILQKQMLRAMYSGKGLSVELIEMGIKCDTDKKWMVRRHGIYLLI